MFFEIFGMIAIGFAVLVVLGLIILFAFRASRIIGSIISVVAAALVIGYFVVSCSSGDCSSDALAVIRLIM